MDERIRTMKKQIAVLLALLFCLSLAACGGGGDAPIPTDVDWEACFVTDTVNGMNAITGTTELGRSQSVLVVPAAVGGVAVKAIADGALSGCSKLSAVYIGADSSISYLNNGAFRGAPSLKKIVIDKKHSEITVSANLLDGAAAGAKVYVPAEYYADYTSYYTWGAFSARIQKQS